MAEAPAPPPLLLRWQGLLPASDQQRRRLSWWASILLMVLLAGLPFLTRTGLGLVVLACGALWILWSSVSQPQRIGAISAWVLVFLGIAVLATGFSPVPAAAAKGLVKLLSYLGVYALMRQLLAERPEWWDRLVAAMLAGEVLTSVMALRQLYGPTEELARWADPNSITAGTIRIYGPLGNPNLLAGYLVPILPLALVALIRWQGWGARCYAAVALVLGATATMFSYSRGGWLGMLAALGVLVLLLVLRAIRSWPKLWRRLVPIALLVLAGVTLAIAVTQVDPIRTRVASLLAGRGDSSNNFRINVWLAAVEMIQDRPWLGIGPGNAAFNADLSPLSTAQVQCPERLFRSPGAPCRNGHSRPDRGARIGGSQSSQRRSELCAHRLLWHCPGWGAWPPSPGCSSKAPRTPFSSGQKCKSSVGFAWQR